MNPETAVLWFSGNQLSRDQLLSKYVGKNEKMKIVIKISKV